MSVLVLDFGSQYTQLIARRVRECSVYSEIKPCTIDPEALDLNNYSAIVLSGGPASVLGADAPRFNPAWFQCKLPMLGVCYGMQLMTHCLGGSLGQGESREYGHALVEIQDNTDLFKGFSSGESVHVWMSHGDHVVKMPQGFVALAKSSGSPIAAIGNASAKMYAVQFHPEVIHTPRGKDILSNFLFGIANAPKNWDPGSFVDRTVKTLKAEIPDSGNVICALSGGVDSSVAAVLVDRAIGKRLHCIFVDNGLVRKNEAQEVKNLLGDSGLGLQVQYVDASAEFLSALEGVSDPEKKRRIIGHKFIEVFDVAASKIPGVTHLVQGTLYPDVIESVSVRGPSATIKSHHNVGGLPQHMKLSLIEPLRELFKDEVRRVGRELGVPDQILQRQPFPGPGLAVRLLGEISQEKLEILRNADAVLLEEIRAAGLYTQLWQSFAVLLPVQSVGVMGDDRTYEQSIAIRAVVSEDGMTADWAYLPEDLLRRVSNRIINEVRGVNRVVLDISSKPPSTIEWE